MSIACENPYDMLPPPLFLAVPNMPQDALWTAFKSSYQHSSTEDTTKTVSHCFNALNAGTATLYYKQPTIHHAARLADSAYILYGDEWHYFPLIKNRCCHVDTGDKHRLQREVIGYRAELGDLLFITDKRYGEFITLIPSKLRDGTHRRHCDYFWVCLAHSHRRQNLGRGSPKPCTSVCRCGAGLHCADISMAACHVCGDAVTDGDTLCASAYCKDRVDIIEHVPITK